MYIYYLITNYLSCSIVPRSMACRNGIDSIAAEVDITGVATVAVASFETVGILDLGVQRSFMGQFRCMCTYLPYKVLQSGGFVKDQRHVKDCDPVYLPWVL